MRIILASQSLLRGKALDILGLEYEKIPSGLDESSIQHPDPLVRARKLAEAKARKVGEENTNALIIAGDLFGICGGRVMEKPSSREEAAEMLKFLSGKEFTNVAGIAVYNSSTGRMLSSAEFQAVVFRDVKDDEIRDYISRYSVTKFAAGIEGDGFMRFCSESKGKYPFLYGLPMQKLIEFLRKSGLDV